VFTFVLSTVVFLPEIAVTPKSCNTSRFPPSSAGGAMRFSLFVCLVMLASVGAVSAQEDKKTDDLKPADPDTGESTVEESTLGVLPNPFDKKGVKFAVTYIGEVLGNPSGGQKQSAVYEDRFNFAVDVDLQKLVGLKQLAFHANVFQIDGGGLSRGSLLNYMVVSGIEALPTTRLYEIWLEQKWEPSSRFAPASLRPTPSS
jgi:porin